MDSGLGTASHTGDWRQPVTDVLQYLSEHVLVC